MIQEAVISGEQCRAARKVLGWSRRQLAEATPVLNMHRVVAFERGTSGMYNHEISKTLRLHGIMFADGKVDLVGNVKEECAKKGDVAAIASLVLAAIPEGTPAPVVIKALRFARRSVLQIVLISKERNEKC